MNILRRYRICRWLTALLLAAPLSGFAQTATGVGFASMTIQDPVNGGTMPGYVFYPTAHTGGVTWIGPYELPEDRDANRAPLVDAAQFRQEEN